MDDLARRVEEAREHVEPHWDAAKVETSLVRLQGRLRRRRTMRVAAVALLPIVAFFVFLGWRWVEAALSSQGPRTIASTTIPPVQGRQVSGPGASIYFADGSVATTLSAESRLVAAEVSPNNVRVRLDGGAARFEVSPRSERLFQVDAGEVSVLVLGTIFSVSREGEQVAVAVERGRVRVAWADQARVVAAGHREVFDPRTGGNEDEAMASRDSAEPRRDSSNPAQSGDHRRGPSWRELADQGRYDEAYRALERGGGIAAVHSMNEALVASDVARLSGHPGQAVEVLERTLARYPSDPQASVASYTLGRVLLNQVGRPRDAAEAFARARRLAPAGALAEDALAREIEAWSRAGVNANARQRAQEYIERYPEGRRLGAVRRFGGLD